MVTAMLYDGESPQEVPIMLSCNAYARYRSLPRDLSLHHITATPTHSDAHYSDTWCTTANHLMSLQALPQPSSFVRQTVDGQPAGFYNQPSVDEHFEQDPQVLQYLRPQTGVQDDAQLAEHYAWPSRFTGASPSRNSGYSSDSGSSSADSGHSLHLWLEKLEKKIGSEHFSKVRRMLGQRAPVFARQQRSSRTT